MDRILLPNTEVARSAVELVEMNFTGELAVDENGRWMLQPGLDGPRYVGPASGEIDMVWRDLIARMQALLEIESRSLTR